MWRGTPDAASCTGYDWEIPTPRLDDRRRVASTGADKLDYRFRTGTLRMNTRQAAVLRKDCANVFALNSSNWLAATAEPRCALEHVARAIFEEHTAHIVYDKASSGAEWWAQVREGGSGPQEGIEFHWDVDEHFCDQLLGDGSRTSLHVHPHLSTVTYLTESPGAAPTVILDTCCPSSATTADIESKVYGPITGGAVSWPRLGKSIVFDGSKLHGAVPLTGQGCAVGAERVTFLLNVWLGHRPYTVEPLSSAIALRLSNEWRPHPDLGAFDSALAPPPEYVCKAPGAMGVGCSRDQEMVEVAFGRVDKVHALRFMLPSYPSLAQSGTISSLSMTNDEDSCRLIFEAGAAEIGPNTAGRLRSYQSGAKHKSSKTKRSKQV